MTMTRDEQLEMVARNIGEWPVGLDVCAEWSDGDYKVNFTGISTKLSFTRSEVEAKVREITGEPDDKDAPEWAESKSQDSTGVWFWYEAKEPKIGIAGWRPKHLRYKIAGIGEVLGDWRDTLKPVKREQEVTPEEDEAFEAMASKDDSDGGVKFLHGNLYESVTRKGVKSKFVAPVVGNPTSGVFVDEKGYYESSLSDMRPAPSERDEFAEAVSEVFYDTYHSDGMLPSTALTDDDAEAYGKAIFDAIEGGRLKAPEVKK